MVQKLGTLRIENEQELGGLLTENVPFSFRIKVCSCVIRPALCVQLCELPAAILQHLESNKYIEICLVAGDIYTYMVYTYSFVRLFCIFVIYFEFILVNSSYSFHHTTLEMLALWMK